MAMRRLTFEQWGELLATSHGQPSEYSRWMGSSPGGAAADLGVTRQRIWQLLKEGKLDLLMLADNRDAKVSAWLIPQGSIERYRKSKPMEQADLLLSKPKRKKAAR
jgi:hypothetical protein